MNFEAKDILEELICPNCQMKFADPRILPCGQTCCQKCVEELIRNIESVNDFTCPFCASIHHVPTQIGFPRNLMADKLVNLSRIKVSINENCKRLDEYLKKLSSISLDLDEVAKKYHTFLEL